MGGHPTLDEGSSNFNGEGHPTLDEVPVKLGRSLSSSRRKVPVTDQIRPGASGLANTHPCLRRNGARRAPEGQRNGAPPNQPRLALRPGAALEEPAQWTSIHVSSTAPPGRASEETDSGGWRHRLHSSAPPGRTDEIQRRCVDDKPSQGPVTRRRRKRRAVPPRGTVSRAVMVWRGPLFTSLTKPRPVAGSPKTAEQTVVQGWERSPVTST